MLSGINITSRPNRAAGIAVLLDPVGEERLSTLHTVNFRADKTFTIGNLKLAANFDVFNVFNGSTSSCAGRS